MTAPFPAARDTAAARPTSRRADLAGTILGSLCLLFLLADAVMKLLKLPAVIEATVQLGYAESVIVPLGIVLLVATVLTALPRTRVFGAILLTGYLGGATATHVRAGQVFVFPVMMGVLVWLSIWLKDERVREIVWRTK